MFHLKERTGEKCGLTVENLKRGRYFNDSTGDSEIEVRFPRGTRSAWKVLAKRRCNLSNTT